MTRSILTGLVAVCAAGAQALPPGTLLLARVKAHTREELARLPNCSCLETITRERKPAGGKMRPLDTVRLEVLYSERHELYAPPGDRGFSETKPSAFVGSGTIGNGQFALYLSEVASEGRLSYQYQGEETLRGRRLARYDYRVPVNDSGHTITMMEGSGTVGMKGTFWADPVTYDIVRLVLQADEIPTTLPVLASGTAIDYAHTDLGGSLFLLPQSAESWLAKLSGEESRNHLEFTHCHLYGAQSSIHFGDSHGPPQFGASSILEVARELLPSLQVTIRLNTPITPQTAVGTLIAGQVVGDVYERKRKVTIPDGAPVRGRVRRLERNEGEGGYYVVALEFTEIEAQGTRYRFFADLVGTDPLPGFRRAIRTLTQSTATFGGERTSVDSTDVLTLPDLPGVGSFFVQADRLELPAGFRTTWKTRPLVR